MSRASDLSLSTLKSPNISSNGGPVGAFNRTRLETNLVRLLTRCEAMAMDTETVAANWRLDKVKWLDSFVFLLMVNQLANWIRLVCLQCWVCHVAFIDIFVSFQYTQALEDMLGDLKTSPK